MKFLTPTSFSHVVTQQDVSILNDIRVSSTLIVDTIIPNDEEIVSVNGLSIYPGGIPGGVSAFNFITDVVASESLTTGTLQWDNDLDTLNLGSSNFDYDIPLTQKLTAKGFNNTAGTINRGKVVSMNGSINNITSFGEASAAEASNSSSFQLAITESSVPSDSPAKLSLIGIIKKLNTSAWGEGTSLYLSPSNPGDFTSTIPTSPNKIVWCGIVLKQHALEGEIFFNPKTPGSAGTVLTTLEDLSDTDIDNPIANDTLVHNGTDWANVQKDWTITNDLISPSDENVDIELGNLLIAPDAGEVSFVNMEVTSDTTSGDKESYSFDMNSSTVMKVYGESDGIGGLSSTAIVIEGDYQYMGDPNTDNSWRFGVSGPSLVFERREDGIWVPYQTLNPIVE